MWVYGRMSTPRNSSFTSAFDVMRDKVQAPAALLSGKEIFVVIESDAGWV